LPRGCNAGDRGSGRRLYFQSWSTGCGWSGCDRPNGCLRCGCARGCPCGSATRFGYRRGFRRDCCWTICFDWICLSSWFSKD